MADHTVSGRLSAAGAGLWVALVVVAAALIATAFVWSSVGKDVDVPPGAPVRLSLAGAHIKAKVVPIQLHGSVLDPPRNYTQVGWWRGSAKPGSDRGQTVITGHTVHTGGGSMNRLGRIKKQQEVDVATRRGVFQYEVDRVDVLSRAALAQHARRLFGQGHGGGRLVLVTCTDWNGTSYDSNIVVTAHRFGAIKRSPTRRGRAGVR